MRLAVVEKPGVVPTQVLMACALCSRFVCCLALLLDLCAYFERSRFPGILWLLSRVPTGATQFTFALKYSSELAQVHSLFRKSEFWKLSASSRVVYSNNIVDNDKPAVEANNLGFCTQQMYQSSNKD